MKISFDLDDTLILSRGSSQYDNKSRLLNGEYLRKGAIELLRKLGKEHELYIYTTSYRPVLVLNFAFWLKRIKIKKIINNSKHLKIIKEYDFNVSPSKYPPHFGIDLHIDDSIGVVEEGKKFNFRVLHLDPEDLEWEINILNEINMFYPSAQH